MDLWDVRLFINPAAVQSISAVFMLLFPFYFYILFLCRLCRLWWSQDKGSHTHTHESQWWVRGPSCVHYLHTDSYIFKKAAPQTPRGLERRQRRVKGEARCERMERECVENPLRQAGGATHLERDAQPAVWNLSRVKWRSSARLWTPASVQCLSLSQRCIKAGTLRRRLNRLFF